jgi:Fur family peroxide stress response transcriptional regulator
MAHELERAVSVEQAVVERRIESIKAASRDTGIKLTHQRLEIFREIAASLEHPDADAVFRAVRGRMPTVSLDTVYRTLWMLNDLGLISTLSPRRESVRFDANLRHHHHYVCTRCGLALDFESTTLDTLRIPETVRGFGSIVATHVEVRGVCDRCAKQPVEGSVDKVFNEPRGKQRKRN